MANIQPFDYQKRTNIEEHNQLVDKVNEIVDVINNANLETIGTDLNNLETRADKTDSDLATVQAKDIVQDSEIADLKPRVAMTESEITNLKPRVAMTESEITNLKPRVAMTESEITNLKTRADKTDSDLATVQAKDITQDSEIDGITKSLVSDVIMSDGTTMGSVQVSIEREDGTFITSKNYKWGRDIGIRLEAGTQAGYVKAVIDLSDGTVLESNEYRIVEVLESDIYVTAITLVADQNAGTLGGNINYSNGTTQTINTVSIPTAPGVTSALESLQSRMTAVEQKNTSQDGQITALDTRVKAIEDTPGVGQFDTGKLGTIAGSTVDGKIKAETDGTGSVNGWSTLKDRVTAVEQKNTSQDGQISSINSEISGLKTKNTEQDNSIAGKVAISQGTENAGKVLGIGSDGNVSPTVVSGGEVWEEIDYSNPPTNWVNGDRIKIMFDLYSTSTEPEGYGYSNSNIVEGMIKQDSGMIYANRIQGDKYSTKSEIYFSLNRLAFYLPNLNNGYFNASMWYGVLDTAAMSFYSISNKDLQINISDIPNYTINGYQRIRMWRLKQST